MEFTQSDRGETPFVPPPINDYGRVDVGSYLRYLMFAYKIVLLVMQVIAMPGEVLLRQKFGARYLDPLMVMLGFIGLFMLGGSTMVVQGTTYSLVVFSFAYLGISMAHRVAIFHRDLKGETWHSQSSGLSLPLLTLPARLIGSLVSVLVPRSLGQGYRERLRVAVVEYLHLFIEPSLIGLAGFAMLRQQVELGKIFPFIAVAMVIKNVLMYHFERTNMLDIVDAAIEAEHRVDVITGTKGTEEAQGYKVSGVRLPQSARGMFGRASRSPEEGLQVRRLASDASAASSGA